MSITTAAARWWIHTDGSWPSTPGDNLDPPITLPVAENDTRLSSLHQSSFHLCHTFHLPAYGAQLSGHLTLIPPTILCLRAFAPFFVKYRHLFHGLTEGTTGKKGKMTLTCIWDKRFIFQYSTPSHILGSYSVAFTTLLLTLSSRCCQYYATGTWF